MRKYVAEMSQRRRPEREPKPMITTIPAGQAARFSILRRASAKSDRLPDPTFARGRMGELGLNPALARRAWTQLGDVWVVPGNGWIALYNGSATANPAAQAATHGMVMWGSSRPRHPLVFVHGLLPDGVDEVTLAARNGTLTSVQVTENVYGATLDAGFAWGRFALLGRLVTFGPEIASADSAE